MAAIEYPIDITPSVADVAALPRARTKQSNGNDLGMFNDDTRPTPAQVETLNEEAVADIQARIGPSAGGSDATPQGAGSKTFEDPDRPPRRSAAQNLRSGPPDSRVRP